MKTRIILGACMIAAIALGFWIDAQRQSTVLLSTLIALLGCAGYWELCRMRPGLGGGWGAAIRLAGVCGTAAWYVLAWAESSSGSIDPRYSWWVSAATVFGLFLPAVLAADHEKALESVLTSLLGVILFGFLCSFVLRIYNLDRDVWLSAYFIFGVKGNDIVAYFCGRAFGRHRFLKVSPKKTLEGCGSAVVFSIAWFLLGEWLWPGIFFGWPVSIALGIIFSVLTQLGDLSESLIKRAFGVKDSAALLPEFGGVLDLIDSTLFSSCFFWTILELSAQMAARR